jgi:hypothetical protein
LTWPAGEPATAEGSRGAPLEIGRGKPALAAPAAAGWVAAGCTAWADAACEEALVADATWAEALAVADAV